MSNVGGRQMAGGTGGTRTAFLVVAALLAGAAPAAGSGRSRSPVTRARVTECSSRGYG